MTTPLMLHMAKITTPEQDPKAVGGGSDLGIPPELNITMPPPAPEPITEPINASATPVGAPLEHWLRQEMSGMVALPQEYYTYFGGDQILKNVQQFDPSAKWVPTEISGGEAGSTGTGYRLEFDRTKLPAPGGGHPMFAGGFRPANFGAVYNSQLLYNDPNYGPITPTWNIKKASDPLWTKLAPLVVGGVAGLAGGAAAAGAASAAEAGPGAAAAVGSQAAGQVATPWWAISGAKAIPTVGNIVGGITNPPGGYNAAAFNAAGSAKKAAGTNDSSLVATQFADDPYGMSYGTH